jgi:hypothetical protein
MQSTFHPALKVFPPRAEKRPKEKKAAYIKLYRQKTAAATKSSDPRMVPRSQHAANNLTPDLLAKPSTSTSTSTENAQKIDEKMQQSFKAIKLLNQDEIDAAADRFLDQLKNLQDDDDSEDEKEHQNSRGLTGDSGDSRATPSGRI